MSKNAFERLSPFIQEYIYRNKWTEIRDIQVAACEVIFDSDSNLLLASGTASGKTEAAFLPILTELYEKPSASIGVLYISPLKALINDQFYRLTELLQDVGMPVTKWHGDVDQNAKNKIMRSPQGVLQTTPESLEAMLMRRTPAVLSLFSDLKFIIIDEVHYFMDNDRGVQLLCILERIQNLTRNVPRRVGLSATLSDYSSAESWLNSGTTRTCMTPKVSSKNRSLRLSMQHFPITDKEKDSDITVYYKYLYDITLGKRCIIFANSKSNVENIISRLKQIAETNHLKDIYHVHHGSISASLREYTERKMKESDGAIVTGATLTLELGIDIGALERIVQTGSPFSVSSFVQRLGRTGRRGNPSEMWFAFAEEDSNSDREFYKKINWDFIKCIALIQLYLEERWIEPVSKNSLPYGILYHQTMSYMASMGEVSLPQIAQNNLTLGVFKNISKDDYKLLLRHLIKIEQLELSERNGVLVGVEGEKEINNYEFFAVFEALFEYAVKNASEEIGTIQQPYPVGTRFGLAGRTWEVLEINKKSQEIFVKSVKGLSTNMWLTPVSCPLHTKVMKKMRDILLSDEEYRYLGDKAIIRLQEIRQITTTARITETPIVKLTENMYGVFPWLGTKAMVALSYALEQQGYPNAVWGGVTTICLLLHTETPFSELTDVLKKIQSADIDKYKFNVPDDAQISGKYNKFIPNELLRKQYIEDYIDVDDMQSGL
ncbi:MAG: hypothetical protein VR72_08580 [Clostridiaceae bacterium BRH_c20a]|nr:MAG: hypothetical protein VR72_08580 [Clostridiaceae bacterium BRH_c20a]